MEKGNTSRTLGQDLENDATTAAAGATFVALSEIITISTWATAGTAGTTGILATSLGILHKCFV
jgi:hypothetical protein